MRHLQTDDRYSNALARHYRTYRFGYFFGENHQPSQLLIRNVENVIHLLLGDTKCMTLGLWPYI